MSVQVRAREVETGSGLREAFAHVDTWIFDLDDTLYPRSVGVHEQLRRRVVAFVARHMGLEHEAAEAIHLDYYERFGSTLQGMVELHGVVPAEFLDFVHDIDLSMLVPNPRLIAAIGKLPGRRVVFTNASRGHAEAALAAMGLSQEFDLVVSIENSGFVGKPHLSAFELLFAGHGVAPATAAMFEDRPGNLLVPHELGMKTILVVDPNQRAAAADGAMRPSHVDYVVENLVLFLDDLSIRA
ncbi:pyrimidine 5'-nucleotidase [Rhodopseudomonas sp. B29]|uniref:pyrimidine 5'-nucleotidase n=1 Tax=Rhodopseudomonas sp. B29 TaxID=95607 RepID=UPI00034A6084|nr:pyrimidine 5'-nucleotidase [Rhodopseudomonas sp. B29]